MKKVKLNLISINIVLGYVFTFPSLLLLISNPTKFNTLDPYLIFETFIIVGILNVLCQLLFIQGTLITENHGK